MRNAQERFVPLTSRRFGRSLTRSAHHSPAANISSIRGPGRSRTSRSRTCRRRVSPVRAMRRFLVCGFLGLPPLLDRYLADCHRAPIARAVATLSPLRSQGKRLIFSIHEAWPESVHRRATPAAATIERISSDPSLLTKSLDCTVCRDRKRRSDVVELSTNLDRSPFAKIAA